MVDPVDGSLNAKRGLPYASLSLAVANGPTLADVEFAAAAAFEPELEWSAVRGSGASRARNACRRSSLPRDPRPGDGAPGAVAQAAEDDRPARCAPHPGAWPVAVTLAVAQGALDAMLSLRPIRSVDAAAGALLVRDVAAWPS